VIVSACGGTTPTVPTPAPAPAPTAPAPPPVLPVPPQPILKATLDINELVLTCVRGYCFSAEAVVSNYGPGCAANVHTSIRWYGADGAIRLPNSPDVPMTDIAFLRAGARIHIYSLGGFNDVRSAHTVYSPVGSWEDVRC